MKTAIKVLVIDDDTAIRESLVAFFEDEGMIALSATSAEKALNAIDTEGIHIAVVDLRLPGLDGTDFIRKAHKQNPELLFIIYTGSPEYTLPQDLNNLNKVCKKVFLKPLNDLTQLTNQIIEMFHEHYPK